MWNSDLRWMTRLVGQGPGSKMGRLETAVQRKTLQEESMHWAPDVGTETASCQCPPGHSHVKTQEPRRREGWASRGRRVVQLQGALPLLKADLGHLVPSLGGYQPVLWWQLGSILEGTEACY